MTIERLDHTNMLPALEVAKRAFDMFIAPDYSDEGIKTFYDFIETENIRKRLDDGNFIIWGAYEDGKTIGVVAIRDKNHISLFSVDKDFQGKRIGKKLMQTAFDYVSGIGLEFVTVNASPYAVPIYHRLGFGYTDVEQLDSGMKYTPMKAFLHGKTPGK